MDAIYPTLISEMAVRDIKKSELAKHLRITERALYNKLQGKSEFLWPEVVAIQRDFFPDTDKDKLFYDTREHMRGEQMNGLLSDKYTKIMVLDLETGQEIAVITNDLITTARDSIVVKLSPNYD